MHTLGEGREGDKMTRWFARRSVRVSSIVAVAVAVVAAAGVAYASGGIPGADGTIQGCYDSGGNLKVVSALPCPKGYTPLQWNQQGQPGKDGTNGSDGTNGTDGVSGYEIVTNTTTDTSGTGAHGTAGAFCPTGKKALGGGGFITLVISNVGDAEMLDGGVDGSFPFSDGTGWAIHYSYNDPTGLDVHVKVYATCATVN
jgi:hypothetical protein